VQLRDREALAQLVAEIVVHRDKLIVRFKVSIRSVPRRVHSRLMAARK